MKDQWIPIVKIQPLIQFEAFALVWILMTLAFVFYKLVLVNTSEKRHKNLRRRFLRTSIYLITTTILSTSFWLIFENAYHSTSEYFLVKTAGYISLVCLFFGILSIVKLMQIYVYLYLFFMNMSVGVPRLIANMFTLVFSLVIVSWLAADVFGFNLAAVLATSAVFSLVLGLALQDTLGNLFSGVALQIDRPFNIGDWVEIHNGAEKLTGQVYEISWRATTLIGFGEDIIIIPNRVIAQGQLLNFSHSHKSSRLSQEFHFHFSVSIELAKRAMLEGLSNISEVLQDPPPRILITEIDASWITIKIFYSLKDYGTRYRTGDVIISQILDRIRHHELKIAGPTYNIDLKSNEIHKF